MFIPSAAFVFLLLCISIEIVGYRRAPTSEDCRPLWVLARTPLRLFGSAPHYKEGVFTHSRRIGKIRGPIPNRRLPLVKQTNLRDVKRLICTQKRFIDFRFASFFFFSLHLLPFFSFTILLSCVFCGELKKGGRRRRRKRVCRSLNQQQQSYVLADLYHFHALLHIGRGEEEVSNGTRVSDVAFFFVKGKKKSRGSNSLCVLVVGSILLICRL